MLGSRAVPNPTALTVASLHIYPIKACGGITLHAADVERMGFRHDRQWMFVDDRGMFVAQRDSRGLGVGIPSVCLVRPSITDDQLTITAPGMPALTLPASGVSGAGAQVRVWDSMVNAIHQGNEAEVWATEFLSRQRPGRYRLVRMPDHGHRATPIGNAELAFGDAYPFLVSSRESLADLNSRLDCELPMNRFRPNIVLRGGAPYEEDVLDRFRIGLVEFVGTTLCLRCPTTTTNQDTAERGKEPLRTLATYRKKPGGVVFGRNFNHVGRGTIRVGDLVDR
jgi:uncharacterized protein YcbX